MGNTCPPACPPNTARGRPAGRYITFFLLTLKTKTRPSYIRFLGAEALLQHRKPDSLKTRFPPQTRFSCHAQGRSSTFRTRALLHSSAGHSCNSLSSKQRCLHVRLLLSSPVPTRAVRQAWGGSSSAFYEHFICRKHSMLKAESPGVLVQNCDFSHEEAEHQAGKGTHYCVPMIPMSKSAPGGRPLHQHRPTYLPLQRPPLVKWGDLFRVFFSTPPSFVQWYLGFQM